MELSNGLIKLTNLKLLSLAGCNLATVPAAVMKLPQLETLILSNNENITLPDDMSGLVNLTAIHLDWCNLDSLPPVVLKLSHLRSLDLSGNEQISLPDELCRLENIKELRLYACFMATVPPAVLKLTQLEKLNLSGNWGIHLPDGLSRLTNIRTLPAEVGQLTKVKHLDLSYCQLHTLPPEVGRLTQLERLDLRNNPIQTLPVEVGQLTNIKHLKLSHYAFYLLLVNLETYSCSEQCYTETVGFWLDTLNARVPGAVVSLVGKLSLERLEPVLSYLQQVGTILRYTDIPELKGLVFHDPPALIEIFKDLFHHDTKALFSTPRFANLTSSQLKTFQSDISDRGLIQKEVMTRLLPSDINLDIVTALMQNFGLCFEIQDEADPSKHSCLYRIPWYLQNQMPEELMSVWPANVPDEQEQLQLMCDIRGFCPRGLFQRFSVGIHPLVKDRTDWKDGVMAYRQDYHVLVCSKPAAGDTYITMATRGRPDQAGEMWGVVHPLLEVLVQLLREWSGVLYSLHVTCAHCIKARLDNPHQYNLRDRTADDGRDVRCPHPEVKYTASTSADLVYRPGGIRGWKQNFRALQGSSTVNADVSGSPGGDFNRLRWLLTEVKVKDDAYDDHYNRLAAHVTELGLRFRPEVPGDGNCMFHAVSDQVFLTEGRNIDHLTLREQAVDHLRRNPRNARGDHLSDFIPNQTWEEYLDTMSRDGTWGDHVVLQAMADMLGRDVIIVSSVEADNYVTVLHPQSQTSPRISLLLGHYAENHYASLDGSGVPIVLLLNDEYGTSKGGISTINCQLGQILVAAKAVVYCTALRVPKQDQEAADRDGVKLIQAVQLDKESVPTLDWLTKYHSVHYPGLPLHVTCIIGHADITDTAARNIWEQRYPQADLMTFNHVLPEDTEYYKGGRKAMKAWEKEKDMLDKCDNAKAAFSVGKRIYDHFDTMYKGKKKPKNHQIFLPKPSKIFLDATVRPGGEQKVVLCIGRVRKVEKLKGHDLVAQSMRDVVKEIKNVRLRVRGISEDDWETSQKILEDNLNSPDLNPTLLPYGTQEDIRDDMMTAHLVLMPSRSEPFGLVGLEAIAAGIPVLISDKTGLSGMILDLIEQKKLSAEHRHVIVETSVNDFDRAGDAKRWADRIVDILNHSDSEFEKAARLKRELVESRYWEESHRTFLQACGIPAGAADL
ncbi:uncharacterized protein LOC118430856 [Branchiostoma floridae]|uniref:Uncharacterized protein LOC118430856 n=1 Tax=Branchiostoma floridae TaxID=7739 RepID=A0A9J7MAR7_BRAFL|nr:uncharacterized protein LOC118430856 [Branchiostoma floridae]